MRNPIKLIREAERRREARIFFGYEEAPKVTTAIPTAPTFVKINKTKKYKRRTRESRIISIGDGCGR